MILWVCCVVFSGDMFGSGVVVGVGDVCCVCFIMLFSVGVDRNWFSVMWLFVVVCRCVISWVVIRELLLRLKKLFVGFVCVCLSCLV